MQYSEPTYAVIEKRYSSRSYLNRPIGPAERRRLADYLATLTCGPLGSVARFVLIAAAESERDALRSLGTYGLIKNPAGFIAGAVRKDTNDLEDFGYLMERAILLATDLGLGTCWLGGTFSRSSFAAKMTLMADELLPAVTATGYSADAPDARSLIRRGIGGDSRLPWQELFFDAAFGRPLDPMAAGPYVQALEAVRLGPSASNKQPWRIVKHAAGWHFYLQRTKGYREGLASRVMGVADLQRVDMGIAMCHFELVATEAGLRGQWSAKEPPLERPDGLTEYVVSWIEQ